MADLILIASGAFELAGLSLVAWGLAKSRREAQELLTRADRARENLQDPNLSIGEGGVAMKSDIVFRSHEALARALAASVRNDLKREAIGAALVAVGIVLNVVAGLAS